MTCSSWDEFMARRYRSCAPPPHSTERLQLKRQPRRRLIFFFSLMMKTRSRPVKRHSSTTARQRLPRAARMR